MGCSPRCLDEIDGPTNFAGVIISVQQSRICTDVLQTSVFPFPAGRVYNIDSNEPTSISNLLPTKVL
ncbi:unnamed protein product [Prunus armeniaca]|uniref:Uncharacterized protein n=1 Tax=Prunus armeniaca TaxID=36596 RepID=A0A6J5U123_PRUAR|nr:unnamed protein product [Prunus armeniaca]